MWKSCDMSDQAPLGALARRIRLFKIRAARSGKGHVHQDSRSHVMTAAQAPSDHLQSPRPAFPWTVLRDPVSLCAHVLPGHGTHDSGLRQGGVIVLMRSPASRRDTMRSRGSRQRSAVRLRSPTKRDSSRDPDSTRPALGLSPGFRSPRSGSSSKTSRTGASQAWAWAWAWPRVWSLAWSWAGWLASSWAGSLAAVGPPLPSYGSR